MNTKLIAFLVVSLAILVGGVMLLSGSDSTAPQDQSGNSPVLFVSDTCPYCRDVEAFMDENEIEDRVPLLIKEVSKSQANAQELGRASASCGLPPSAVGVPFLYAEGSCYVGAPDIISYLSEAAGISEEASEVEIEAEASPSAELE
jgi:glutaredoxin